MLRYKTFQTANDFHNFFLEFDLKYVYPLINTCFDSFLWKDCFSKDNFAKWTAVESDIYHDVLAIYCILINGRKETRIPNSIHLSEFEVNELYRGQGFGTEILNKIIVKNKFKNITLFSKKEHQKFYEFCGFKHYGSGLYVRKYDII